MRCGAGCYAGGFSFHESAGRQACSISFSSRSCQQSTEAAAGMQPHSFTNVLVCSVCTPSARLGAQPNQACRVKQVQQAQAPCCMWCAAVMLGGVGYPSILAWHGVPPLRSFSLISECRSALLWPLPELCFVLAPCWRSMCRAAPRRTRRQLAGRGGTAAEVRRAPVVSCVGCPCHFAR